MSRRVYVYFLLTFVLGLIIGAAGMVVWAWNSGHWRQPFGRRHLVRNLSRDLNLNDAQVKQLNQIIDGTSRQFEALHRQVEPQFESLRKQSNDQIRAILNPDQAKKFDEMVRRWRARMRHGPPP